MPQPSPSLGGRTLLPNLFSTSRFLAERPYPVETASAEVKAHRCTLQAGLCQPLVLPQPLPLEVTGPALRSAMKFLLVFDFDHTIIDENSDTWIVKCAPERKLPNGLRNSYQPGHWTEYMGRVFVYLGDNGVKEDEMKRTMTTIPFTAGMIDLLGFIGENKELFDCIIVSDSNTVFIDWILKAADFHKVFDEVFTNPAAFSSTGYLTVQHFHAHHCTKCPKNLCKRKVLKEFLDKQLERGVSYTQIIYIGDGGNDLCPVTFLKKNDIAMPRQGYTLEKRISQLAQSLSPVQCSVLVWSSAIDIMSYLKSLIKE